MAKVIKYAGAGIAVVGAVALASCVSNPKPVPPLPLVPFALAVANSGILPNAALTPGALNPDITQDTIAATICNPHWTTKSIRPPSNYTTALKKQQLANGYALNGDTRTADYEEDHLISLELGGNPTDPKNLWPESYTSRPNARDKDKVENAAHKAVCAGSMVLADAQQQIASDWVSLGRTLGVPSL